VSTRRDLLRRLGLTAVLTAGMSAITAIFPEVANAACRYNGCEYAPGTKAGVYCGWCSAVTRAGRGASFSHAFMCNGSKCCSYGPRASCEDPLHFSPCG
jgi:hypothetical protein